MSLDVSTIHTGLVQQSAAAMAQHQAALQKAAAKQPVAESKTDILATLRELEKVSAVFNHKLSFRVNEKLDQVVVKVVDAETEKTIREIPPAELQHVRERIREVIGILFDEQA